MTRQEIINLSKKNIKKNNLEDIKNILDKNYEISYGKYDPAELKKCLNNQTPFFIDNYFIIGYENNNKFITDKEEKITIERMVKAVVVEKEKEIEIEEPEEKTGDNFAIIGYSEWEDISEFISILGNLKVGEVFLPPHSAIFNFKNPSERELKEKIVSCTEGVNINIFSKQNYIDNAIHEIGHLFWRGCLIFEEKKEFDDLFKVLKPSAIFEYEWERKDKEEVFATIYKWYVKSLLINKSFYNILEYECPKGLNLFLNIIDRIAKDKIVNDIWALNKEKLYEYLNPRFDKTTGLKFVKKGLFDDIKDLEIPNSLLNNINKYENGITFINLAKAIVPVKDNKIDWKEYNKDK